METKNINLELARDKALKRIEEIKGFYIHVAIYVVFGLVVMFTSANYISFIGNIGFLNEIELLNWIDWRVYGTPIIWGIALIFHALSVFVENPFLGKAWEERQIKKYLEKY